MSEKQRETNIVQWSADETKYLLGIWTSTDFQQRVKQQYYKSKLYAELSKELARPGFQRTTLEISSFDTKNGAACDIVHWNES